MFKTKLSLIILSLGLFTSNTLTATNDKELEQAISSALKEIYAFWNQSNRLEELQSPQSAFSSHFSYRASTQYDYSYHINHSFIDIEGETAIHPLSFHINPDNPNLVLHETNFASLDNQSIDLTLHQRNLVDVNRYHHICSKLYEYIISVLVCNPNHLSSLNVQLSDLEYTIATEIGASRNLDDFVTVYLYNRNSRDLGPLFHITITNQLLQSWLNPEENTHNRRLVQIHSLGNQISTQLNGLTHRNSHSHANMIMCILFYYLHQQHKV